MLDHIRNTDPLQYPASTREKLNVIKLILIFNQVLWLMFDVIVIVW